MIIKEYTTYHEDEIVKLYASVGWTAYTKDPETLKKITVPVLVTAGENDLILPSETKKIAEMIPRSTLMILEGYFYDPDLY